MDSRPPGLQIATGSRRLKRRMASLARRFRRNDEGVAAIEFGFIASTMLVMLIGIVDISNAVSQNWRLSQLNRTISDLASQASTMDANQGMAIFTAAAATMSPYNGPLPRMSIYSVVINGQGQARVCWAFNSTGVSVMGLAPGNTVVLPNAAMAVPNTSYIVTAADMTYQGSLSPNFDMNSKPLYFRPRQGVSLGPNNVEQVGFLNANGTTTGC